MSVSRNRKSMTPKGKKSLKENWKRDEEDPNLINLTNQNGDIDDEVLILDGILTARIHPHRLHPSELVEASLLSNDLLSKTFFLHPTTADYLDLKIGDLCRLTITDHNEEFTGTVWPQNTPIKIAEVGLSVNILAKYKLKNNNFPTGLIEVEKIPKSQIIKASKCNVTILRGQDTQSIDKVEIRNLFSFVQKSLVGSFFIQKETHKVTFLGRRLTLRFDKIESQESQNGIIVDNALENLSLEEKYFEIKPDTIFIESSKQATEDLNQHSGTEKTKLIFNKNVINTLENSIIHPIENYEKYKIKPPTGFILHGQSGIGKSELLKYIIERLGLVDHMNVFRCETRDQLDHIFTQTDKIKSRPALVIFDHFEMLMSNPNSPETRSWNTSLVEKISSSSKNIFFLVATSDLTIVNSSLRREGFLETEIEIPIQTDSDKIEILKYFYSKLEISTSTKKLAPIIDRLHGFVASDIVALIKKSYSKYIRNNLSDFNLILSDTIREISPSAMKSVVVSVSKVKWDDIGGYEHVRASLRQLVEWPLKYPSKFKLLGIRPPKGVLLYGPPGCSKTMVAKALATESGLNFLSIKGAELLSKYVGESEAAVRKIFAKARQAAPSILFFDEIDAVAVSRGEQNSVVTDRMITTLLTELDGITDEAESRSVVLIAATNRPQLLDSALLRPGRIDRFEYISLPNAHARKSIVEKIFSNLDVQVDTLVERLKGYSGAEIVSLKTESAYFALERSIKQNDEVPTITQHDIERALEKVKPRTKQNDIEVYREFAQRNGQTVDDESF